MTRYMLDTNTVSDVMKENEAVCWRTEATPMESLCISAITLGELRFGIAKRKAPKLERALEEFLKPGMRVLDAGTGSGILARAAKLLGAGKVYACDKDPVAVEIAGDGFVGSVDAVAAGSCDLVVANISPEAIVELAPDLVRVLRPGGVLLASGFELHEVERMKATLPPAREVRQKGNWALLICGADL